MAPLIPFVDKCVHGWQVTVIHRAIPERFKNDYVAPTIRRYTNVLFTLFYLLTC